MAVLIDVGGKAVLVFEGRKEYNINKAYNKYKAYGSADHKGALAIKIGLHFVTCLSKQWCFLVIAFNNSIGIVYQKGILK